MSKKRTKPVDQVEENEIVEAVETVEEDTVVEESQIVARMGTVTGCKRLNVRQHPDTDAPIVCILDEGTILEVVLSESTDEFYKVYHSSGIEGFCMKTYIAI